MTTISTKIPDTLFKHVQSIAEREDITIDQFIAIALASQISSWEAGKEYDERAKRGNWNRALEILDRAPDVEPPTEDRLQ